MGDEKLLLTNGTSRLQSQEFFSQL